jgi:hypothetical protein
MVAAGQRVLASGEAQTVAIEMTDPLAAIARLMATVAAVWGRRW